jgi:hypothetical protein
MGSGQIQVGSSAGIRYFTLQSNTMNETLTPRPASPSNANVPKHPPEPYKVQVTLLDQDNLPLARGTATLPLLFGAGVFWPSCPMPASSQLATAKCFALPSGEILKLRTMDACAGSPPRYNFWVNMH